MGIEFRLLEAGVETAVLPDVESFSLSPVLCDEGAVEFSYPKDGLNWQVLAGKDEFFLAVYLDGVRQGQLDAVVKEIDGDDVEDSSVWKFTGFFTTGRLAEAIVFPKGWPSSVNPADPKQRFTNVTPGALILTFMQQAQSRGTLTDIGTSTFTGTTDSKGAAWTHVVSLEYAPGVDYLTVLKSLHDQQVIEFEIVSGQLKVYEFQSLSTDRTAVEPPLIFRRGRDLLDSPRKKSTRDLGTTILASGADGLFLERVDSTQVAARRRIEIDAAQGQVKDTGTLSAYADAVLAQVSSAKMEKTHGLVFVDSTSPRPIRDFNVGDWAYSDMGNGLERLRIKQWVLKLSSQGELTGSVTLNDFFAERNEMLTRRIEGIIGGSTIAGGSKAVSEVPGDIVDNLAPKTPTGLSLSSDAYMDNQGLTFAQFSATWLAVTQNADNTILEDLEGYQLQWRYETAAVGEGRILNAGNGTFASWSPVTPGVNIYVRVRAYDRAGNFSPWSAEQTILTASDGTAPEAPAAPLADNYLGLFRIRSTGATASGAAVAKDQKGVWVHVSTTNNFTPTVATRTDFLSGRGAGVSFYKGAYGVALYTKLQAEDHSGNLSTPSAQASASPSAVVSADVFDGAIGTLKLADLAVTTAKINDLAVNDAKIGSVSVGKLTAGIINAQVTISGRLGTALTGARREMNSIGFQAYDASNNLTISLDGVDNLLTGKFKTAISDRRIEIGTRTNGVGLIEFIAPDGATAELGSFSSASAGEVIRMGPVLPGVSQFWNKTQMQHNSQIYSWSAYHKISVGGDNAPDLKGFDLTWAQTRGTEAVPQMPEEIRFSITSADATFNIPYNGGSGGSFRVNGRKSDNSLYSRFWVSPTHVYFQWPTNNSRLTVMEQSSAGVSARLQLVNTYNYGSFIRFFSESNGTSSRVDFTDANETVYIPILASAFNVSSSQEVKEDITDFGSGGMDVVRKMRPRRYRRKPGSSTDGKRAARGPVELGLVVEESPAEVLDSGGKAINLYAMLTAAVAAINELDTRLDTIEQRSSE